MFCPLHISISPNLHTTAPPPIPVSRSNTSTTLHKKLVRRRIGVRQASLPLFPPPLGANQALAHRYLPSSLPCVSSLPTSTHSILIICAPGLIYIGLQLRKAMADLGRVVFRFGMSLARSQLCRLMRETAGNPQTFTVESWPFRLVGFLFVSLPYLMVRCV